MEHLDVDEALRLMECSKESLYEDGDREFEPDKSAVSQIFRLIKGMAGSGGRKKRKGRKGPKRFGKGPGGERDMDVDSESDGEEGEDEALSIVDIRSRIMTAGFTEAQLMDTIAEVGFLYFFARHLSYLFFSSMRILMYGRRSLEARRFAFCNVMISCCCFSGFALAFVYSLFNILFHYVLVIFCGRLERVSVCMHIQYPVYNYAYRYMD